MNPAVFYGFSFAHHGKHAAFHGLAAALSDQKLIDVSPPVPEWLPAPIRDRLTRRWLRASEWWLYPYFRSRQPRVIHYFFPENTMVRAAEWKRDHYLIATVHQPAERMAERADDPYYAGFIRGLKIADLVVVQSLSQESAVQEILGHDRTAMVPLGVDASYYQPPSPDSTIC